MNKTLIKAISHGNYTIELFQSENHYFVSTKIDNKNPIVTAEVKDYKHAMQMFDLIFDKIMVQYNQ